MGFPGVSAVKKSPANVGNAGSIPGLGRSLGVGQGNPLQYSCLEKPMDRGAWRATGHQVTKSQTRLGDLHTRHNGDADIEKVYGPSGRRRGGTRGENSMETYASPHAKAIASGNLL